MNIIARIAFLELRGLFYSPVAWLVLIVFTIPPGLSFASLLLEYHNDLYLGGDFAGFSLTQLLFASRPQGLFTQVLSYAHLYIPLLTMGLISRELGSGSIKLLYSSPINVTQIVLGKFLALLGYGVILIGILGLFVFAGSLSIESMDVQFTLAGLLGLFLLIAAYAAIGLFMSCLTAYQVVAAVSTMIGLATLNYIGKLGRQYDFVRDITYFLSVYGRSENFVAGLISSKDVAYFLIVIAMFLALSMLKLQSGRESLRSVVTGARYALVVAAALMLGYVSSRPALWLFYDTTVNKDLTLAASSQALVARMPQPLKITTYVNLLDSQVDWALPQNRNNDLSAFESYIRFKPDIEMRYVYYYDVPLESAYVPEANPGLSLREVASKKAETVEMNLDRFLSPDEIRKVIDLRPEENSLVRQVEYGGKKAFLRMFDGWPPYPGESEINAVFERLLTTPPTVAFLAGHGERRLDRAADADYQLFTLKGSNRFALINQGFDVETLDLQGRSVPDHVAILVIANPKEALTAEAAAIQEFIERGGSVLIAADPGDQALLNPLLAPLGVQFMPGNVVGNADLEPDFVVGALAAEAVKRSDSGRGLFDERTQVATAEHGPSIFATKKVTLPGAVGIQYGSMGTFAFHPVIFADAQTNEQTGEHKRVPIAVGLTRELNGKEQRLMVIGDADFMSKQELARRDAHLSFTLETFKWLSHGKFPVDTSRPKHKDNALLVDRSGISMWKAIFCGVLPALIAMLGAIVLLRRRWRV